MTVASERMDTDHKCPECKNYLEFHCTQVGLKRRCTWRICRICKHQEVPGIVIHLTTGRTMPLYRS